MKTDTKSNASHLFKQGGLYRKYFKRPMDFILSLIAIILLSPVLILVSILVKVKLGSPVIFKQRRPGLNDKIFTMYKFRTMTNEKDENGKLLPDSDRITRLGMVLRATSIDELPELFNILKGNMSIVGPRPQLVRDMIFMTQEQRKRHSVLPGLTGWAQVNGRNNITWEEKFSLDLEYIRDISFIKDWKIIFMTVSKVFIKEGVSSEGLHTSEDFGDYLLRVGRIDWEEYEERLEKANV